MGKHCENKVKDLNDAMVANKKACDKVFQTCRKAERETADKINSCNKHNRPSVNCAGVATTPVKQNTTASSVEALSQQASALNAEKSALENQKAATDAKAAKAKESVETADKVSKKITELTKTARLAQNRNIRETTKFTCSEFSIQTETFSKEPKDADLSKYSS